MGTLRDATLVILVKKRQGEITDVCLALKKRGFGINRWNGVSGKVNGPHETIEEAARRETQEEIGVLVKELAKVAELTFYFPHNPAWDQLVHVYLVESWEGEPNESEEMKPAWFSLPEIPFPHMWPDDAFWLPKVLKGRRLKAAFKFGEGDIIQEKEINIVDEI